MQEVGLTKGMLQTNSIQEDREKQIFYEWLAATIDQLLEEKMSKISRNWNSLKLDKL